MESRGWEALDFICVTGDAYVDHPSFGIAIISRVVEHMGYRVGIVAQPVGDEDYRALGAPRFGFLVTGGNVDSMVANYTVAGRYRYQDAYSPGGKGGRRPDRAAVVYCRKLRELFPGVPIVLGGLEASMRRFAHYDYWSDRVLPSIMLDSGADVLSFGMGERQTRALARALAEGKDVRGLRIPGICYMTGSEGQAPDLPKDAVTLPSFARVREDKAAFARATARMMEEQDAAVGRALVQKQTYTQYLVQLPPAQPLETEELDEVFALPFTRMPHPAYDKQGGVPAIEEVQFSVMHNRGCFGSCNFCSIAFHQGARVTSRSHDSVVEEVRGFTRHKDFKGVVSDVGGPTANFRHASCEKQKTHGICKHRKCLAPTPCPRLTVEQDDYLTLLRKVRAVPGVRKVFVRSGLRYDYMMLDKGEAFFQELLEHHVSGQLKVAPEHSVSHVLDHMGKPRIQVYRRFAKRFYDTTRKMGKEQYLIPYLISSHPGATLADAVALAVFLKQNGIRPRQVQDFYPTPGTVSTAMFYTGLDVYTGKPIYVAKTPEEKAMQRALLQYFMPENRKFVEKALIQTGQQHLAPELLGHTMARERHIAGEPKGENRGVGKRKNTAGRKSSPQNEKENKAGQARGTRGLHSQKLLKKTGDQAFRKGSASRRGS